jgi:ABC-2 type transport system permease protein
MRTFWVAFRKDILEQWRTNRMMIVGVVLVFFGISSPLLAKFMPELLQLIPGAEQFASLIPQPTVLDAYTQYLKNIGQFIILLALLVSMGSVAIEKEKGTAAMMLVKPLPRGTFLLSKFFALSITFLAGLGLTALAAYYYTVYLFGTVDFVAWITMNALVLVYALMYVAITLLFSTLVRSQAAAAGLSFGALILFSLLGAVPAFTAYMPAQLLDWALGVLTGSLQSYWPALGITLSVIGVCLLWAWLAFDRQEL